MSGEKIRIVYAREGAMAGEEAAGAGPVVGLPLLHATSVS